MSGSVLGRQPHWEAQPLAGPCLLNGQPVWMQWLHSREAGTPELSTWSWMKLPVLSLQTGLPPAGVLGIQEDLYSTIWPEPVPPTTSRLHQCRWRAVAAPWVLSSPAR